MALVTDIILDARSSRQNDSTTALCWRYVKERASYVAGLRGDILFFAEGNGDMKDRGKSLTDSQGNPRTSEIGESFLSVHKGNGVIFGGTKSTLAGESLTDAGLTFSWSRNDSERTRFEGMDLLSGGLRVSLGVVGGDLEKIPSLVGGIFFVGSQERYALGEGAKIVGGELSEYVFEVGVFIAVGGDGSVRIKEGQFSDGDGVYFSRSDLTSEASSFFVGDGVNLAPIPAPYEEVYLRVGSMGHLSDVLYFETDDEVRAHDFGEWGAGVSLQSGLLKLGSGYDGESISYEGLLLGRNVEMIDDIVVSQNAQVGAGDTFQAGLVDGELEGLKFGVCFLNAGGVRAYPVVYGNSVTKTDRAYVGSDGVLRFSNSLSRIANRGTGVFKLCQGLIPCKMTRGTISQKAVASGSVLVNGGSQFTWVDGVVTVGAGLGKVWGSGHVEILGTLDQDSEEYSLVRNSLGSGLYLGVRSSTVNGFRTLQDEVVGEPLAGAVYNFLDFVPRTDMESFSYGGRDFFKTRDVLSENNDVVYSFTDRLSPKIGWVQQVSISQEIKEPTGILQLDSGIVVGNTSIKISRGAGKEELTEGVDYDLPFDGQAGFARLTTDLSPQVLNGNKLSTTADGVILTDGVVGVVSVGDFFVSLKDGYYRRVIGVNGLEITLSSIEGLEVGSWVVYKGQDQDLDLTRANDECFVNLPLLDEPDVAVYLLYTWTDTSTLDRVVANGNLFLSDGTSEIPLVRLRSQVLNDRTVDLTDDHVTNNQFQILVDGVQNVDWVIGAGGLLEFNPAIDPASEVTYVPTPMVVQGQAEIHETTLAVPNGFSVTHLVEELTPSSFTYQTEAGTVSFLAPLGQGVGVEIDYLPQGEESRVRETVLFVVPFEKATRVDARNYTFNQGAYTQVPPVVYIGPEQLQEGYYVSDQGTIRFDFDVPDSSGVAISYARQGSLGGEYTVKTSSLMTRTEISLDAGATTLSISGRSDLSDVVPGLILDMGTHCFLVQSVSGNKIELTPPSRFGLNINNVEKSSKTDLFISVGNINLESKPKSSEIFIAGDYTSSIFADTVLVLENTTPYRAKKVEFDSGKTKITVGGYTPGYENITSILISVRPVYTEGVTQLKPLGQVATDLPYELIREENGLGTKLTVGSDYVLNGESGTVALKNGYDVRQGVRYTLRFTAIPTLSPAYDETGGVNFPKYSASFLQTTDASSHVGYPLLAKCVIETKDKFKIPVENEADYDAKVAGFLLQEVSQTEGQREGGAGAPNQEGVSLGLYDPMARDVVARNRVRFYNDIVNVVDDLISTSTGKVVGDADGKFRFDFEQGDVSYVAPGLEDPVTREIIPRYATLEYFDSIGVSLTAESSYSNLSPTQIKQAYEGQLSFVENEMDDYILVGTRSQRELTLSFPFIQVNTTPVYDLYYKPSSFSRLYPQQGKAYSILYDSPAYTAGRYITSFSPVGVEYLETTGSAIGQLENLSWGKMTNVGSLSSLNKRPARFRVFDYSASGFPSIAPASAGKPSLILSVVPLEDFPVVSGVVDTSRFITASNPAGDVLSVETGDPELAFKGLQVGSSFKIGRVGVGMREIVDSSSLSQVGSDVFDFLPDIISSPRYATVESIHEGCVVVLSGSSANLQYKGTEDSFLVDPPVKGDTFLESFSQDLDVEIANPTYFRVGTDIGLRSKSGELIDISLPSALDLSFPEMEINGQNVPEPLTAVEAVVDFTNPNVSVFEFPALRGEDRNDDGEYSIPFITTSSERTLLGELEPVINEVLNTSVVVGPDTIYAYPDEIPSDTASVGDWALSVDKSVTPLSEGETPADDVKPGDLALVSIEGNNAYRGFIEVAQASGTKVYGPRFKVPVPPNSTNPFDFSVRYRITNYYVSDFAGLGTGIRLEQTLVGGIYTLRVYFNEVGAAYAPTYDNLITFVEDACGSSNRNSFRVTFLQNCLLDFHYNGSVSQWFVYFPDGVNQDYHVLVTSISPIVGGLEIESATPILDADAWVFISNDGGSVTTVGNNYSMDNAEDCQIDVNFYAVQGQFGQFYTQNNIFTFTSASGSQTAEILSDRLTFRENANAFEVVPYSDGATNYAELGIFQCKHASALAYTDGTLSTIQCLIDLNNHDEINDGSYFRFYSTSQNEYTVQSIIGAGNVDLQESDLSLSVMVGSRVDADGLIFEGSGYLNGYEKQALSTWENFSKSHLISVDASDDISKVKRGDLVYIDTYLNSGVHRVHETVNTSLTDEDVLFTLRDFPFVTAISDNGDGSFDIEFNKSILNYAQDAVNNDIYLLISDSLARSADPNESGMIVAVAAVSVDGLTITTEIGVGPTKIIGGVAYDDGYDVLVQQGMKMFGVDKLPISTSALGLTLNDISFDVTSLDLVTSFSGETNPQAVPNFELIRDNFGVVVSIEFDAPVNNNIIPPPPYLALEGDSLDLQLSLYKGIYLDPEFPRMGQDYGGAEPNYFGTAQAYGVTGLGAFIPQGVNGEFAEVVSFSVRRLRRFSDLSSRLNNINTVLSNLYEVRRGVVQNIVENVYEYTLTASPVGRLGQEQVGGSDTQLGAFTDTVSVGDKVSVYDVDGNLSLRLKVLEVGANLRCSYISGSTPAGNATFEIETRTHPIPQEQAFNKFLDVAFTKVYQGTEGFVDTDNELKDAGGDDFTTLGFQPDQYVVIDPAGILNPAGEYGAPRKGDTGRLNTTGYVAGTINPLDDNRGVYKVGAISADTLTVEPVYTSEGYDPGGYLLLPSLDGVEGGKLRITADMDGNGSFASSNDSVSSFSWAVYERNSEVSQELAESILFLRERTLSWAEKIKLLGGFEGMSWELYEDQGLVAFIGENDYSYATNAELRSVIGNINVYPVDIPFVTSDECLSVLDRRFLIESPALLLEGYSEVGTGLPTLLESGVSFMEAREKRISWINVRVGLLRGTLPERDRVNLDNPNLKALEDIR